MTYKYTFFWDGPFSQWRPTTFIVQGMQYNCAEQYMMHQKALLFNDTAMAKLIMETSSPRLQKQYGRSVGDFDWAVWKHYAKDIVYVGNHAKFTQHMDLLLRLIATSPTILVEASPTDSVWGIGLDAQKASITPQELWPGTNWLGEVLTQLRDDLIANKPFDINEYQYLDVIDNHFLFNPQP